MAEIINLRRARKARQRAEAERTAAENRARFGRTKAERHAAERDTARMTARLDGARREAPDIPDDPALPEN
ncbi:DUF4169 family protein [Sphingobium algorifonticola]|uniref:DUF4169 family protein n=1 Tax=Sphingobium algorifonticola TaxID=2008318 RepID=A0A437JD47_9SPHN|nr:DUF4169 family protein [Sphingobium algorifonticola]RVT43794.1 DUF4169 family protein [Sphingobium algorifonticola]